MAKRILLADDSLTIQKVVELTFSDGEYDLFCVSNGQRALDRVQEQAPDLILADVVMPEKNGYEVCEAIKSNPATARIPVVLLSGTFEPFDRDRAERLGCDAIVSKPFDSQQLLRQVEALLARDPRDVPSASTMAIPIMPAAAAPVAPPAPPTSTPAPTPTPTPSSERGATEPGFSADDFTGSIPRAAQVAGGPDLFEEEYGQADVESAIAAFEKAHPEFAYVEDGASTRAMTPDADVPEAEETQAVRPETADDAPADRGWLSDAADADAPSASVVPPPPAAPAPFWVPRQPEPELAPIPFAGDDSANRRTQPEPQASTRADEGPTQQIRLSADFASLQRDSEGLDLGEDTDRRPALPIEAPAPQERTAEIPLPPLAALASADVPDPVEFAPPAAPEVVPAAGPAAIPEPTAVPREIEEIASTTSIGQLKEMFSSVSRTEGGLTDDEIDRLASRVVERLSEKIVREIAWEVIPDVAELVIKQRIKELESGVD